MLKSSANISTRKKSTAAIWMALLFFLCQNIFSAVPATAIGLPAAAKDKSMLLPSYEKLFQGAGPMTNENKERTQDERQLDSSDNADLSPMTLNDKASVKQEGSDGNTEGGALLKSTVSTTDYLPKDSDPNVMEAQSIKGVRGHKKDKAENKAEKGSLTDQAAAVKVGPLPLLETDGEVQQKADAAVDAEKTQLADLWESTLTRSPDIQFIVQKLQPTSNQAHLTNVLAKMLSTAAFGGLGAMSMMSPNMGTFAAASMGSSMIQTALGVTQSKADKKAKLSQEEEIMMYNMVRTTCDKLVSFYRQYKKCSTTLSRAADDLQDLQNMVNEAKAGQDAAKQLEMEYTLRKQQRDMDAIAEDLHHHRQNLVDLSGSEAVAKLDKQLVEERGKLKQIAGDSIGSEPDKKSLNEFDPQADKRQTASGLCPQS